MQELRQPNRFIGVCDVDEMVWNATQFLRRRLCGSDGHPAVELAASPQDDLSAELLRQDDTERCLSNRRGPNDRDQGGGVWRPDIVGVYDGWARKRVSEKADRREGGQGYHMSHACAASLI